MTVTIAIINIITISFKTTIATKIIFTDVYVSEQWMYTMITMFMVIIVMLIISWYWKFLFDTNYHDNIMMNDNIMSPNSTLSLHCITYTCHCWAAFQLYSATHITSMYFEKNILWIYSYHYNGHLKWRLAESISILSSVLESAQPYCLYQSPCVAINWIKSNQPTTFCFTSHFNDKIPQEKWMARTHFNAVHFCF